MNMQTIRAPRIVALTSLALLTGLSGLAGCDGPITGWAEEIIFNETPLDAAASTFTDHEFRVCKDGESTPTTATGEVRARAVARGAGEGSIVISQWLTRDAFEAGEEPLELARGPVGERLVGELEVRAPFSEPGRHCGSWSILRVELESSDEELEVALNGSFEIEFLDDDAPLRDFDVEVVGWPD